MVNIIIGPRLKFTNDRFNQQRFQHTPETAGHYGQYLLFFKLQWRLMLKFELVHSLKNHAPVGRGTVTSTSEHSRHFGKTEF